MEVTTADHHPYPTHHPCSSNVTREIWGWRAKLRGRQVCLGAEAKGEMPKDSGHAGLVTYIRETSFDAFHAHIEYFFPAVR